MTIKNRNCKLCQSSELKFIFSKLILDGKISANYFECPKCGLLQSDHLENFKRDEIHNLYNPLEDIDTGASWRQDVILNRIQELKKINLLSINTKKVLDFGCGSGILINLLHQKYNWDVIGYDPFNKILNSSRKVFKEWHEIRNQAPFDFIIATEVFEHFINPRDEMVRIGNVLNKSNSRIYVTTGLYKPKFLTPSWNYLAPLSGQHVNFYSKKTHYYIISLLGGKQLLNVGENYEWLYILKDGKNDLFFRFNSYLKSLFIRIMVKKGIFPKIE